MRYVRLALILMLLPLLVSCAGMERVTFTLITEGEHHLTAGEVLPGEIVIGGGELTIAEGAKLTGSLFIVGGRVILGGEVDKNVSVLLGEAILTPSARVGGDLQVSGGVLTLAEGAQVAGRLVYEPTSDETQSRSPGRQVATLVLSALPLSVAAYLSVRYRPQPLQRLRHALTDYPLASAAMGLLGLVVFPTLLLLMVFTVLLIPAALIFGLAILLGILGGWLAMGLALGAALFHRLNRPVRPETSAFVGTAIFLITASLLQAIPWLGLSFAGLAGILGLGALMLTRFATRRFIPAQDVDEDPLYVE
jgi:cytoskeletal protein CcmA (bactofilin family)